MPGHVSYVNHMEEGGPGTHDTDITTALRRTNVEKYKFHVIQRINGNI